jgi:sulfoacetaldehyde dehydrogenase
VGNAVHVVDETGHLDDGAAMIARAKPFDFATSCLAHESIYQALVDELVERGGRLLDAAQKAKLQAAMWPEAGQVIPALNVVPKSASHIASLAGIELPDQETDTRAWATPAASTRTTTRM